jgi:outer membrane receptor protein involved in Fe transport
LIRPDLLDVPGGGSSAGVGIECVDRDAGGVGDPAEHEDRLVRVELRCFRADVGGAGASLKAGRATAGEDLVSDVFQGRENVAAGASAVSLRGLSTNSTLVLFDGQRAAYYPLADDGSRNFVDLNTIPDDIVERIEVLRDGASSTYGADAIAGVVNIITRRQFNGVRGRAEAGISQDGNNPTQRLSLTAGTGDLDADGINAYVSGFFFKQGATMNSENTPVDRLPVNAATFPEKYGPSASPTRDVPRI